MKELPKLTRWKLADCKTCGAKAGGNCTTGSGIHKKEQTTYVHTARRLAADNWDGPALTPSSRRSKSVTSPITSLSAAGEISGMITTAYGILQNPNYSKVTLTAASGESVEAWLENEKIHTQFSPA